MLKSMNFGRLAGIPIRLHWTFLLLAAVIVISSWSAGMLAIVLNLVYIAAIFLFVVLHELGHALMARRFGIGTHSITLLPIGGVASLTADATKPREELLISLAGPAVNFVLAPLFFLAHFIFPNSYMLDFATLNLGLGLFNLVPAFPTDGGRILRALLTYKTSRLNATEWAVKVSKTLALILGVTGIFYNPMLTIISIFIWMAGNAELNALRYRAQFGAQFAQQQANSFNGQVFQWRPLPYVSGQEVYSEPAEDSPQNSKKSFLQGSIFFRVKKPDKNPWIK